MCGIVGYAGDSEALPVLVEGIRLLSYRGYDSAGVAVARNGTIAVAREKGRIEDLAPTWDRHALAGSTGVGHTRWATHGRPSRTNAHPQTDATGAVVVVHNGVVENDIALREELEAAGVRFTSETDTEVCANLFARAFRGDPVAAAREVLLRCRGRFALAFLHRALPGTIVALRRGSPLVVGLGRGETLVASDVRALAGRADRVLDLHDEEVAVVTREGAVIHGPDGRPVAREAEPLRYDEATLGKGPWPHWMLKEIHEQPDRLRDLVAARVDDVHGLVRLDELGVSDADLARIERVDFVACGTAGFAALYGARAVEAFAGVPARAVPASEYEPTPDVVSRRVLVVAVSQSGETADTHAAAEAAVRAGARTVGVLNARSSRIARSVEGFVDIHAGPEVGVASTKAYTGMLLSLLLLALRIAHARGRGGDDLRRLLPALRALPDAMERLLKEADPVRDVAREVHRAQHMIYLGRGPDHATALEGALKMKEISYIHAEGFAAGEMKHGPIALVSWDVPTVAILGYGDHRLRMLASVREVRARDGVVVALAAEGDADARKVADVVVPVPVTDPWLAPLLHVVPLQMLAYEVAKRRGCDIDQPRNLAKSVTVQ
ncbi:MAG TPA: glutamine--fructose-6-phosphate transaminase (isomerizing) [Planctomycetota bacterium]|jgi:glucosamine--fructose-6-phosphate aminotransferase (isomerizing)|nr:glutamine--fructose-6-phosphate transaminase (isomerizing) [Planctomycetota bacterium]